MTLYWNKYKKNITKSFPLISAAPLSGRKTPSLLTEYTVVFFTLILILENLKDYNCYGKYSNTLFKCLRRKLNHLLRMWHLWLVSLITRQSCMINTVYPDTDIIFQHTFHSLSCELSLDKPYYASASWEGNNTVILRS